MDDEWIKSLQLKYIARPLHRVPPIARRDYRSPLVVNSNVVSTYRVFLPFLLWVVRLPSTGWEYMFVLFIPATQNDLPSMRLKEIIAKIIIKLLNLIKLIFFE